MNRSVIWKLLSFTFAMITLPIGSYFFIVNYVFVGEWPLVDFLGLRTNTGKATTQSPEHWRP